MTANPMRVEEIPAAQNEKTAEKVLRKMSDHHIRVAVMGNVDAGKSTFIGCQVSSKLDNGRGSARAFAIRNKHELETGRTSTATTHLVGLNDDADIITWEGNEGALVQKASRLISFMDLAGHEKYLKTTIAGVARGMADYALILVNSMQPPTHMTLHHLRLCIASNIPVIIIMTKVDRVSSHVFQSTKREIQALLREVGLRPFAIRSSKDIMTVSNKVAAMTLTPIVSVSSVTGEGLHLLNELFVALPQRRQHAKKQRNKPFEYLVEDVFHLPGVGTVLSGFVTRGEWKKGEALNIGPLKNGTTLLNIVPKSVHVAQTLVDRVWAGHSVCFAIPKLSKTSRETLLSKFMVAKKEPISVSKTFHAQVFFVKGNTITLTKGKACITAHILHNKQPVKIVDFVVGSSNGSKPEILRQGDSAVVNFQFKRRPQYVRPGMRIILRDGHVRGLGFVISNELD